MQRRALLGLAIAVLASGCQRRILEEFTEDGLRHLYTRTNSKSNGTATIRIPVDPGETAMLATVEVDPPFQVHFRTVFDPDGASVFRAFEWNQSPYSKTNAGFVADTVTLNWPVAPEDGNLINGRWEFEFGVVDSTQQYSSQPVFLDVVLKADDNFNKGKVKVAVIFTGDLEEDGPLGDAVAEALVIWEDLYAQIGMEVSFFTWAYDAGPLLPPAFGEEEGYVDIAASTDPRTINLVLSDQIAGYEDIFGIAGDIPGPLIPTNRSAVQISTLLAAGPDGEFSNEDVRLLAETMAHETAHFLGLFHPVETDWEAWDVLDDTDQCGTESQCIDRLGNNLMFPFPICGGFSQCIPQDELTDNQKDVMQRYTGTY